MSKKKISMLILIIAIICAVVGSLLFFLGRDKVTYKIESTLVNSTVGYNSDLLAMHEMSIVKHDGKTNEIIEITPDMIVSGNLTNSVGDKQLVIEYKGITFVINFTVKYKVDFVVKGSVVATQYVLSEDEINLPNDPVVNGCDFLGWDSGYEKLQDNTIFTAKFAISSSNIPDIGNYTFIKATYGDKLADIKLPSNANGSWQFVSDGDTLVGNAGKNKFDIMFVPTNTEFMPSNNTKITIDVAKKELEFTDIVDKYYYNGSEKMPNYRLPVNNLNVVYTPYYTGRAINAGSYVYDLAIKDKNYTGSYRGTMEIKKVVANIDIADITPITINDPKPNNYQYSVTDVNGDILDQSLIDIMGIEVIEPQYTHAGTYYIDAIVSNDNFISNIKKGVLTVNKITLDMTEVPPTFVGGKNVVYGNTLDTVIFENNDVRGVWSWENSSTQILTDTEVTVNAVFTPYESRDYETTTQAVTLNVNKRSVTIKPKNNIYTYSPGIQRSLQYDVIGLIGDDAVEVIGNELHTNANSYDITLSINPDDKRYIGEVQTQLVIEKASIADFSKVYDNIPWSTNLTLSDIVLDEGYTWDNANTLISGNKMGISSYNATFTPEDTENYKIEHSTIAVNIVRANASISYIGDNAITYNPNGYNLNVVLSHNEVEAEYTYRLNDSLVTGITNVGNYSVTITIPETEHYNAVTATFPVEITKVINTDRYTSLFSATYGDSIDKYSLPTSGYGTWSWQTVVDGKVGNAGSITHKAVFIPHDTTNYEGREISVSFDIAKKKVSQPNVTAKVYDGSDQIASVSDTSEYRVVTNNGGKTAGEYDVVFELKDSANYRWEGLQEEKTLTLKFKITKSDINDWSVVPDIQGWKYGETANDPVSDAIYGDVIIEYKKLTDNDDKYTTTKPSKAGSYVARFSVADDISHVGLQYHLVEFKIQYVEVDIPKIASTTYNGLEQSANICTNSDYTVITNKPERNAGEYTVVIRLNNDSYKWPDSYELTRELKFVIKKVVNTDIYVSGYSAVYGDNISKYALPDSDYGTWSWQTVVDGKVGNAGSITHKAVFVPHDTTNYEGREISVSFDIAKKKVSQPNVTAKVYDGSDQIASVADTSEYRVVTNNGGKTAGEYDVVFELKDSANYRWEGLQEEKTLTLKFKITKSDINNWSVVPDIQGWKYGETANDPVSDAIYGDVITEYKKLTDNDDKYTTTKPSKAGTYVARFTVADTVSYKGLTKKVEFSIDYVEVRLPSITSTVYNGSAQTADIEESDKYSIDTEVLSYTNAGTYKISVTLVDDSYKWSDSYELTREIDFVIAKVQNTDTIPTPKPASYGDSINKICPLPSNDNGIWSWQTVVDGKVGNAGSITHKAVFTPHDTTNYEGREISVSFDIAKKKVSQPNVTAKVYDGSDQIASVADTSEYRVVTNNGGKTAGEYDVVFELKDSANYRWEGLQEEKTLTLKFKITKSDINNWSVVPDIQGWKYGETANDPVSDAIYGDVIIEYKKLTDNDDKYTTTKPSKAGTYVARFTVADTVSYKGLTEIVEFSIDYVEVRLPSIASTVYNGSAQTADIEVSDKYSIDTEVLSYTNAGTYKISVTLLDDSYKWSDSYELTREIDFVIAKVQNTDTIPTPKPASYGDSINKICLLPPNDNGIWSWQTVVDGKVGNAGSITHKAVFTPHDTTNYEGREVSVVFSIDKKRLNSPTITGSEYNESKQVAIISDTSEYRVVKNNGGIDIGEYPVVLELKDSQNYEWANSNTAQLSLIFRISKTVNKWTTPLKMEGWTFGDAANTPVYESKYGEAVVMYKLQGQPDTSYTTTFPVNAGSYIARFVVAGDDNYGRLDDTVSFVIEHYTVPVPLETAPITYDGEYHAHGITPSDYYTFSDNGEDKYINAGSYDIVLTLDSANYKWSDNTYGTQTLQFVINKVENNDEVRDKYTATYGDLLFASQLPQTTTGTWSWVGDATTTVGDAGTATHTLVFTPDDTVNYMARTETVTFAISKKGLSVPSIGSMTYDGVERDVVVEASDLYSQITTAKAKNAKTYTVQVQLVDNANYAWIGHNSDIADVTFTINKYEGNDWTTTPDIEDWTYFENASDVNGEAEFGDVTVMYKLQGQPDKSYTTKFPEDAGSYVARFEVEGTESYNGKVATVEFNIIHYTVPVPTSATPITYDGEYHAHGITPSDYYAFSDNGENKYKNAGSYDIVLTLDSANYKWSDNTYGTQTLQFVINKVENTDVVKKNYMATYGDLLFASQLPDTTTGTWSWVGDATTPVGDAGTATHTLVFTPDDTVNYMSRTEIVTFAISKKGLSVPSIGSMTYDGVERDVVVATSDLYRQITTAKAKNAKTYTVQVQLEDSANYAWIGLAGDTADVTFTINKYEGNDWTTTPDIEDWTYFENASDVNGEAQFGEVTVMYKLQGQPDTSYTTKFPEDAGSYIARFEVEGTESYNGKVATVEFNIIHYTVPVPSETTPITYDGEYHTHGITPSDYYAFSDNGENKYKNAGSYDIVLTLDSVNYKWSDNTYGTQTLQFVINKVENADEVRDKYTATYGDLLFASQLPQTTTGTWSWVGDATTTVGDAGTATHTLVFAPDDTVNYMSRTEVVTFSIAKCVLDVQPIPSVMYDGSEHTASAPQDTRYTASNTAIGTNVGDYPITLTLVDAKNYWWSENNNSTTKTIYFSITKSNKNNWDTYPSIEEEVEYTGSGATMNKGTDKFGSTVVVSYKDVNGNTLDYVPTDVGIYTAVFTVPECTNYNGIDFSKSYTIVHKLVSIPEARDYTYNASSQTILSSGDYTINMNGNAVTGDAIVTNAGTYNISLALPNSNYKWSDGSIVNKDLSIVVDQATNEWITEPSIKVNGVEVDNWNYFENSVVDVGVSEFGEKVSITFIDNKTDQVYTEIPTDAGNYTARFEVAGDDNYTGLLVTKTFVISAISPTIIWNETENNKIGLTGDVNSQYLNLSDIILYENTIVDTINTKLQALDVTGNVITTGTSELIDEEEKQPWLWDICESKENQSKSITVRFNPGNSNYNTVTFTINTTYKAVCYIGSTYYGSIEKALNEAVSNDNIVVIPDISGNVVIADDAEIKENVTLTLPYLNASGVEEVNSSSGQSTLTATDCSNFEKVQMTNQVVIYENVTVTNNGTIMIAGELSGGNGGNGAGGHTARYHAEIEMQEGSKILSNGTITCYGIIDVSSDDNESTQVIVNSGTITVPFVVNDFQGGTYMSNVYPKDITPFNQFEFRNVIPKLIVKSTASMLGNANLYAKKSHNNTQGKIIGNSKEYLIQLNDGAYIEAKYNPIRDNVDNNKWAEGICDLHMFGGATTNSLSLTIFLLGKFNTDSVDFPLSWRFKITLHSGDYTMTTAFKMLPGHEFTVESDANLTATSINIYSAFPNVTGTPTHYGTHVNYYQNYDKDSTNNVASRTLSPAKFVLRGTLTATSVGGNIYTDTDGATIVTTNKSATTKEFEKIVKETQGWIIKYEVDVYYAQDYTNLLTLYSASGIDVAIKTQQFDSVITSFTSNSYKMSGGKWIVNA